jgi:hypothetical protein
LFMYIKKNLFCGNITWKVKEGLKFKKKAQRHS